MERETVTPQTAHRIAWWQHYLSPFYKFSDTRLKSPPSSTLFAYILPFVILACTVFGCTYWLYSNEYFIEQALSKAEAQAKTLEDVERIERTRDGLEYALRNPGIRVLLSGVMVFVVIRSLVLFLLLMWLLLSVLSSRWKLFLPFWLLSSSATSILSLGLIVNSVLKVVLLQEMAVIGPLLFMSQFDSNDPFPTILAQFDVFLLWFFGVLSFRVSYLFEEKPSLVFILCVSCWMILILILRLMMSTSATLTLN